MGDGADCGRVRRGGDRRRHRCAEPGPDPSAPVVGGGTQPGGRRRAGPDGVGWRKIPVWRWFVLGAGVGVAGAWLALLALGLGQLSR